VREADVNRNGKINARDRRFAASNLNARTSVRPLELQYQLSEPRDSV
jgi:hypothetical protein